MNKETTKALLVTTCHLLKVSETRVFEIVANQSDDFPSALLQRYTNYWKNHGVLHQDVVLFCEKTLHEGGKNGDT